MVRYSVAVCVYEMAETVGPALSSVLDQVDDDFEVVVVDGGSTDGTLDTLDRLSATYDALRVVRLAPDPDRLLGADRRRSVREARGDYVLVQLDADDRYEPVVRDFVSIYHDVEAGRDRAFFLSGDGLNMAPRDLLVEYPYRNLQSGEDRDLWRRLFADDAVVWLDHAPVCEEIGPGKSLGDRLRRDFENKVADCQVGLGLADCLRWSVSHPPAGVGVLETRRGPVGRVLKSAYDLVTYPVARAVATRRESFETPASMARCGALAERIDDARMTLREVEAAYGVDVDRDALTERGRELLDVPPRREG